MNEKLMDSYLDNIAEQVVDEDRIVTYKYLSRNLGIHVNTAKQLLYTYLTNEKSKNAFPISATYLVAGKVVDGSFNVTIVNEADLKNAYSNFVEVTSEHVYSVQKGKAVKDLNVLCGIKDSSTSESSKLVIKCSSATTKSSEVKKKVQSVEENNKKVLKEAFLPEKEVPKVKETVQKTEAPAEKESSSKSPKKPSPKGNQQKPKGNVKKPGGNIANLFAKAAQKTSAKAEAAEKSNKTPTIEETKEKVSDVDDISQVESKKPRVELKERSESKERVKKKEKGNKRKRIQMMSDSEEDEDSDEEEEEKTEPVDDDDDVLPCSLNLEEEKEEYNFVPKNKRKKRKVIDKTVMNEDGYLETKKEIVFETDSENETEETSTAAAAQQEQKKSKPTVVNDKGKAVQGSTAKKQSSLLTFFKKS